VTEVRFHSGDPTRPARSTRIEVGLGSLIGAFLLGSGIVVTIGLAVAPSFVSALVESADRLAVRQTAQRGQEALESVRRRQEKLEGRLVADELFLARVATITGVSMPVGFPADPLSSRVRQPDLEFAEAHLARRVGAFETLRRRIASARPAGPPPSQIPSRSPVEPASAVPLAVFGTRLSPLTKRPEFHVGLALATPLASAVLAPAEGKVLFVGTPQPRTGAEWRALGTILVLAHGDTIRTVYGHVGKTLVKKGATVRRGDTLAQVGQSGWASVPQLHYEVRLLVHGRFVPVDPRLYVLDADWLTPAEVRAPVAAPPGADLPDSW